jgi:hypothetical protein
MYNTMLLNTVQSNNFLRSPLYSARCGPLRHMHMLQLDTTNICDVQNHVDCSNISVLWHRFAHARAIAMI